MTPKIIRAACRIAAGSRERLMLGRLDIQRDWGWAPEYVEAMWKMLKQDQPEDFVIATGKTHSLQEFVSTAFAAVELGWRQHGESDPNLMRPTDLAISRADPSWAKKRLGWQAQINLPEAVKRMILNAPAHHPSHRLECQRGQDNVAQLPKQAPLESGARSVPCPSIHL